MVRLTVVYTSWYGIPHCEASYVFKSDYDLSMNCEEILNGYGDIEDIKVEEL